MTTLVFFTYAIAHHAQILQMLTGNRSALSRATWRSWRPNNVQVFMRQREACSHQFSFLSTKKIYTKYTNYFVPKNYIALL